ncbi:MAG: hypothetical protein SNJ84_02650 [Verrucomicrobiia bacterium]
MADDKYVVRWKGKELGRFSRSEIVERLKAREWSVHHEVEEGGRWRGAGEFVRDG